MSGLGSGLASRCRFGLGLGLSCAASGCVELSSDRCRAASSWVHTVLDPEKMYYYYGATDSLASPPACYISVCVPPRGFSRARALIIKGGGVVALYTAVPLSYPF